jgi:hypothetical protein
MKKPYPNPIEEDLAASRTESEPSGTSEIAKIFLSRVKLISGKQLI